MDLLQLIVGAAKVGKYFYDDYQAKKTEETDEFKEELKDIENELNVKDDYEIALRFKRDYANYDGEGLISPGNYNGDVQFKAYINVLKSRGFEKIYAKCTCGKQIGFLMLPPYDSSCIQKIEANSFMNKGLCDCELCGRKSFRVISQYISVEEL